MNEIKIKIDSSFKGKEIKWKAFISDANFMALKLNGRIESVSDDINNKDSYIIIPIIAHTSSDMLIGNITYYIYCDDCEYIYNLYYTSEYNDFFDVEPTKIVFYTNELKAKSNTNKKMKLLLNNVTNPTDSKSEIINVSISNGRTWDCEWDLSFVTDPSYSFTIDENNALLISVGKGPMNKLTYEKKDNSILITSNIRDVKYKNIFLKVFCNELLSVKYVDISQIIGIDDGNNSHFLDVSPSKVSLTNKKNTNFRINVASLCNDGYDYNFNIKNKKITKINKTEDFMDFNLNLLDSDTNFEGTVEFSNNCGDLKKVRVIFKDSSNIESNYILIVDDEDNNTKKESVNYSITSNTFTSKEYEVDCNTDWYIDIDSETNDYLRCAKNLNKIIFSLNNILTPFSNKVITLVNSKDSSKKAYINVSSTVDFTPVFSSYIGFGNSQIDYEIKEESELLKSINYPSYNVKVDAFDNTEIYFFALNANKTGSNLSDIKSSHFKFISEDNCKIFIKTPSNLEWEDAIRNIYISNKTINGIRIYTTIEDPLLTISDENSGINYIWAKPNSIYDGRISFRIEEVMDGYDTNNKIADCTVNTVINVKDKYEILAISPTQTNTVYESVLKTTVFTAFPIYYYTNKTEHIENKAYHIDDNNNYLIYEKYRGVSAKFFISINGGDRIFKDNSIIDGNEVKFSISEKDSVKVDDNVNVIACATTKDGELIDGVEVSWSFKVVKDEEKPTSSIYDYEFYTDKPYIMSNSDGETFTVNVISNKVTPSTKTFASYVCKSKPSMIKNITCNNGSVTFDFDINTTYELLEDDIILEQIESKKTTTIRVRQLESGTITFDTTDTSNYTLDFTNNVGGHTYTALKVDYPCQSKNNELVYNGKGGSFYDPDFNLSWEEYLASCFIIEKSDDLENENPDIFDIIYQEQKYVIQIKPMIDFIKNNKDRVNDKFVCDIYSTIVEEYNDETSELIDFNVNLSISDGINVKTKEFHPRISRYGDENIAYRKNGFSFMGYAVFYPQYKKIAFYIYTEEDKPRIIVTSSDVSNAYVETTDAKPDINTTEANVYLGYGYPSELTQTTIEKHRLDYVYSSFVHIPGDGSVLEDGTKGTWGTTDDYWFEVEFLDKRLKMWKNDKHMLLTPLYENNNSGGIIRVERLDTADNKESCKYRVQLKQGIPNSTGFALIREGILYGLKLWFTSRREQYPYFNYTKKGLSFHNIGSKISLRNSCLLTKHNKKLPLGISFFNKGFITVNSFSYFESSGFLEMDSYYNSRAIHRYVKFNGVKRIENRYWPQEDTTRNHSDKHYYDYDSNKTKYGRPENFKETHEAYGNIVYNYRTFNDISVMDIKHKEPNHVESNYTYDNETLSYYGSILKEDEVLMDYEMDGVKTNYPYTTSIYITPGYEKPNSSELEEFSPLVPSNNTYETYVQLDYNPLIGISVYDGSEHDAILHGKNALNYIFNINSSTNIYSKEFTVNDKYDILDSDETITNGDISYFYHKHHNLMFKVDTKNISPTSNINIIAVENNTRKVTVSIEVKNFNAITSSESLGAIIISNPQGEITINLSASK